MDGVTKCWSLAELSDRWARSENDLLYMAAEQRLELSVWCKNISFRRLSFQDVQSSMAMTDYFTRDNDLKVRDEDGFDEDGFGESKCYSFDYCGWLVVDGSRYAANFVVEDVVPMRIFRLERNQGLAVVEHAEIRGFPMGPSFKHIGYAWHSVGCGTYLVRREELVVKVEEIAHVEAEHPEFKWVASISNKKKSTLEKKAPTKRRHDLRELIIRIFEKLNRPDDNNEVWDALADSANDPGEIVKEVYVDRIEWVSWRGKEQKMGRKRFNNLMIELRENNFPG